MKKRKYLTDFKLRIKDEELACHKVVLSARSKYFQALFDHPEIPAVTQGVLEFKTLQLPALQKVVDYCYSGVLEFKIEEAKHLIEVAEHLQFHDLTVAISALVIPRLTIENCVGWSVFSDTFGLSAVQEAATLIMLMEFASVVNGHEFYAMEYKHFTDYMSLDDVDVNSALIAAARWVKHDFPNRQHLFPDIMKTVDIDKCSRSALKHFMDTYGADLVTSFDMLQQFTSAALIDAADWQEPAPGAGYEAIVLGGFLDGVVNTETWMINLATGAIVDRTDFPSELCKVFIPAVCDTPKGVLFSGGAATCTSPTLAYSDPQTQCVLYQKLEDSWALLPASPDAIMGASAVCVEGTKVYVVGGLDSHMDKMHCLDLFTKRWSTCPKILKGLVWPLVGCVEKCIYVLCSTHPLQKKQGNDITLQCFDTTSSTWSWKRSLPKNVKDTRGASIVTVAHQLYIIGGFGDICLSYDSTNDTWTRLTPPYHQHAYGAGMYFKNRIVLCGGRSKSGSESDMIENYNMTTNKWQVSAVKLPKHLWTHCIVPCN